MRWRHTIGWCENSRKQRRFSQQTIRYERLYSCRLRRSQKSGQCQRGTGAWHIVKLWYISRTDSRLKFLEDSASADAGVYTLEANRRMEKRLTIQAAASPYKPWQAWGRSPPLPRLYHTNSINKSLEDYSIYTKACSEPLPEVTGGADSRFCTAFSIIFG